MSSSVNVPNAEPVTENIHTLIHQAFFAPSISDSSLLSCHRRFPTLAGWSWGIILCIDYKRMQMAWIWDKMAMTCRGLLSASGVWGFRTLHYWSLISQTLLPGEVFSGWPFRKVSDRRVFDRPQENEQHREGFWQARLWGEVKMAESFEPVPRQPPVLPNWNFISIVCANHLYVMHWLQVVW